MIYSYHRKSARTERPTLRPFFYAGLAQQQSVRKQDMVQVHYPAFEIEGGILVATLGGWNIDEMKPCKMPQKVASAYAGAMSGIVGAEYEPVLYVGSQMVNGTNYCLLAVQRLVTVNAPNRLVKIVIHEDLDGTATIKTIRAVSL